jgi:hypothetical protein
MSRETLDIASQMMLRIWVRVTVLAVMKAKVVAKGVWKTRIGSLAGTPRI